MIKTFVILSQAICCIAKLMFTKDEGKQKIILDDFASKMEKHK